MGQGMLLSLREAGIRPVLTDEQGIETAVRAFVEGRLVERPGAVC
jgi:predicted Fe-Mo cluster-binding NifX family protein